MGKTVSSFVNPNGKHERNRRRNEETRVIGQNFCPRCGRSFRNDKITCASKILFLALDGLNCCVTLGVFIAPGKKRKTLGKWPRLFFG